MARAYKTKPRPQTPREPGTTILSPLTEGRGPTEGNVTVATETAPQGSVDGSFIPEEADDTALLFGSDEAAPPIEGFTQEVVAEDVYAPTEPPHMDTVDADDRDAHTFLRGVLAGARVDPEGWDILATAPLNGRIVWLVAVQDQGPAQVLRGYHYQTREWRGSVSRFVPVSRWVREFTTQEIEGVIVGWHADSFALMAGPLA